MDGKPPDPLASRAALTEAQEGLITRRQLVDVGCSSRTFDRLVERGRLIVVFPGVFRLSGRRLRWQERVRAAVLWGGDGTVASHRCAARLHGLELRSGVVEVTVPAHTRAPDGVKVHYAVIDPADVRSVSGIPVTSPARTLLTIGSVVPQALVEQLLDEALIKGLVTLDELVDVYMRVARRGMPGVAKFRRVLAMRVALPNVIRSKLERKLLSVIRTYELPQPETQYEVHIEGQRYEIDAAYPDLGIAVEADGHEFHLARRARQADLERQNALILRGWLVMRFTWQDVTRHPQRVAEAISAAISSRTFRDMRQQLA